MPEPALQARQRKRGLWMATRNASVSHARELAPDTLAEALATGEVPAAYAPHLSHLLDKAPVPMVRFWFRI